MGTTTYKVTLDLQVVLDGNGLGIQMEGFEGRFLVQDVQ